MEGQGEEPIEDKLPLEQPTEELVAVPVVQQFKRELPLVRHSLARWMNVLLLCYWIRGQPSRC